MEKRFYRAEPYFFSLVCILNALPVLIFRFFPTMDGPAHLYNSTLIGELAFNASSPLHHFYVLNATPSPNWLGHILLALVSSILPAWLAEKALLISYFILLPLAFRKLVSCFDRQVIASYYIIPFTYSLLLFLGFYNFCLALILLFFTLAYWVKKQEHLNLGSTIVLFLLITATYFSHLFVYAILLLTLFLLSLKSLFDGGKTGIKPFISKNLYLLGASALSLILALKFMGHSQMPTTEKQFSMGELFQWIYEAHPLIGLNHEIERPFTIALFIAAMALTLITVYQRFRRYDPSVSFIKYSDVFLLVALIMLVFYFAMPDGAGVGMISDRFCLMLFLFLFTWLATQLLPKLIVFCMSGIVLLLSALLAMFYTYAMKDLSSEATQIEKVGEYIEPYSTVLPINLRGHWLMPHFSNYAAINKPIIMLENYEASLDWFPVNWNNDSLPKMRFGDQAAGDCFFWKEGEMGREQAIDYILVWGNGLELPIDCKTIYAQIINENYKEVYSYPEHKIKLYQLLK